MVVVQLQTEQPELLVLVVVAPADGVVLLVELLVNRLYQVQRFMQMLVVLVQRRMLLVVVVLVQQEQMLRTPLLQLEVLVA